jgi:hypothetical protein
MGRPIWWLVLALSGLLVLKVGGRLLGVLDPVPHPRDYRAPALDKLTAHTEVLFLGSSHVSVGIDPERFGRPSAVVGAASVDYECLALLAPKILSRAPGVRTVVIEADIVLLWGDALGFYRGNHIQLYALGLSLRELPRSPYWKFRQSILENRLIYPVFFARRLTPRALAWERQVPDSIDLSILNGHAPIHGELLPKNDGAAIVERLRPRLDPKREQANGEALLRLVGRLEAEHCRVVLLRMPHHRTYQAAEPRVWEEATARMVREVRERHPDVRYLDFRACPALGDREFVDGHHMNVAGAAAFAAMLDPELQPVIRDSDPAP